VDDRPVTRYAKAPDGVSMAFQVTGDGFLDLVFIPGIGVPVDLSWGEPGFARFARRLGGFSRTVWCESRGIGASGGDPLDFYVDEITDADLTAVLDAAECERVVLVGTSHGGPPVIQYAATHPERVTAVILINTYAHYTRQDGYPWGIPLETLDRFTDPSDKVWGTGALVEVVAPSKTRDEEFRARYALGERLGLGPHQVAAGVRAAFLRDVRPLLPTLSVPTLVLHREGNRYIRVGAGRYLAEHIPGAKYVELPGDDHFFFVGDTDALLDEIEEFLTGAHQAPEGDVVTSTILFTDIVSSTEQAARMGHRNWTALVDQHDAMVRATLARHRGCEVKTTGDGFLTTFDATTRAVRAAKEIVAGANNIGLDVRAGVHTGEVEVRPDDVVGLAVTIAKRICDLSEPRQVLVSETVKGHLVGSGIALTEHGTHVLKGVPDEWRLFAVKG
jgi:class 3 adenylate cyclase/pimeloyl-ACP methyl ester carboxylesterase